MKIYLAGNVGNEKWDCCIDTPILESFVYINNAAKNKIPKIKYFLLDSGAFTWFSAGKEVNWDDYVEKYAAFINEMKIKKFFELDIDSLIGFQEVLRLRNKLERLTGKQSIPVWHISRGIRQFEKDASEYPYIALGGIVSGEWSQQAQTRFPWFIKTAHQYGAKIHGLGYTSLQGLKKYHFDSVDSTAWTTGNRFGCIYRFNGKTMQKINVPPGKRLKTKEVALHNFKEWAKFSRYAESHL